MMLQYEAIIQTSFVALHCWPDAPEAVSFLANLHRHEFHVQLVLAQQHDDRDVEYVLARRWLDNWIDAQQWRDGNLGVFSCEMIAAALLYAAQAQGYRPLSCTVLEDGENGARVHEI